MDAMTLNFVLQHLDAAHRLVWNANTQTPAPPAEWQALEAIRNATSAVLALDDAQYRQRNA